MAFSRRQFLKLAGGSAAGAAVLAACRPAVREFIAQSPVLLPEDLVTGVDNWYATLCQQCSSGCGIQVRVIEGRAKKVEGNPLHPVNAGKLCVRGQAGVQALYHPDRIRRPMRKTGGRDSLKFVEISWDEALDEVVGRLSQIKADGAAANAIVMTEPLGGHLGALVSRFASAYGAGHVAYEPIDQAVLKAAIRGVFGQDSLPFFDIANSRYLLSFGADFLGGWISQVQHSRGYGEFRQGDGPRGSFTHVDSRFSMTAANADRWVPIRPGWEGKLALSIAYVIIREGLGDAGAADDLTGGRGLDALAAFRPDRVAGDGRSGVTAERIEELALEFAAPDHQPALAIGGGTAGAHTNGVFNLSAIYALNHLVGNVGKPGGVIFNPAAPDLRGSLFTNDARFGPAKADAFPDVRAAVDRMRSGQVSVLLVHSANPVHGLPAALNAHEAVRQVPYIVSLSSFLDDTSLLADLVLPSSVPLEDWADGVAEPGPGHQTVGFQQPVVRPFQETRGFGDILLTLAQELGMEAALPWETFRDVLMDGAQRLQGLNRGNVTGASFGAYWNDLLRQGGWWDSRSRSTASTRASAISLQGGDADLSGSQGDYPFNLVPFESIGIGDGRGAHLPWLQATPDPMTTATWATWVEVNQKIAKEMDLREGDVVTIESPAGSIEAAVYPNMATPPWVLGIPMGQGHKAFGRYAEGRGSNPLAVVDPDKTDRETGALAWAATRVRMVPTGRRIRIPKMEGTVLPIDFGFASGNRVIKIAGKDE